MRSVCYPIHTMVHNRTGPVIAIMKRSIIWYTFSPNVFFEHIDIAFETDYCHDLVIIRKPIITESQKICALARFNHWYSLEFFRTYSFQIASFKHVVFEGQTYYSTALSIQTGSVLVGNVNGKSSFKNLVSLRSRRYKPSLCN